MSISNYFYHGLTKKYIAIFGSVFNKMSITRTDSSGAVIQQMPVPIQYGNYQKFLQANSQAKKDDKKPSFVLPRMSFEIMSINYDGSRKIVSTKRIRPLTSNTQSDFQYVPAPYNIDFNLYVIAAYAEDAVQIAEQIWPHFKPEHTVTAKMINNYEPIDVPIILNNTGIEDTYEGDFESRRTILYTFNFVMKCWFYGPEKRREVIKFIDIRTRETMTDASDVISQITIQPGLTIAGEPTEKLAETIPYEDIVVDDNWGVVTIFRDSAE